MKGKSLFYLLTLCTVALCPFSKGEALITETNDFAHAFTYLEKDTLYVFDLDNTLIETAQHLGSDQWFSHHLDHCLKTEGLSVDEAIAKLVPVYSQILDRTEMQLVEPIIADLLAKMQKQNVPMIGLTKRSPALSERTLEQIAPLHIDFSKTSLVEGDLVFKELKGTLFKNGIIFTGNGIDKGPALNAYLKKLKKLPNRIVVIDDKLSHIENIEAAVEKLGIDFVGIRYGGADEKVKSFNPKIAQLQLDHFHKILSDEQALHLLKLEN